VASAEVVAQQGSTVAVDAALHDQGQDRIIASATAIFER
jgi:hypothetical protein